jgi:hypothetical protein
MVTLMDAASPIEGIALPRGESPILLGHATVASTMSLSSWMCRFWSSSSPRHHPSVVAFTPLHPVGGWRCGLATRSQSCYVRGGMARQWWHLASPPSSWARFASEVVRLRGRGEGSSLEVTLVKNQSCLTWDVSRLGDDGAPRSSSFHAVFGRCCRFSPLALCRPSWGVRAARPLCWSRQRWPGMVFVFGATVVWVACAPYVGFGPGFA